MTNSWKRSIRVSAASSHAWMPMPRSWSVLLPRAPGRGRRRGAPATSNSRVVAGLLRGSRSRRRRAALSARSKTAAMVASQAAVALDDAADSAALHRDRLQDIGEVVLLDVAGQAGDRLAELACPARSASGRGRCRGLAPAARRRCARRSRRNAAARSASSGKRRSSDWQKAWMVWIFMPPGAVQHLGEQPAGAGPHVGVGAVAGQVGEVCLPGGRRGSVAQRASVLLMRFDISAAAALVKVRQRMRDGWVPASSRRSTRSRQHLGLAGAGGGRRPRRSMPGSEARRCLTLGSIAREDSSMTLIHGVLIPPAPRRRRTILDAGEMAVVVVARRLVAGGGRER